MITVNTVAQYSSSKLCLNHCRCLVCTVLLSLSSVVQGLESTPQSAEDNDDLVYLNFTEAGVGV